MNINICITLLCLALFSTYCDAETIKFAFSSGKPAPYVIDEKTGIEIEIVTRAFDSVGIKIEPVWFTYKRMDLIKTMEIDGRGVTKPQKGDGLFYSEPYIFYQDVALTRSEDNIKLNVIEEMEGFRVGAWQTAAKDLGGEFEKLFGKSGTFNDYYFPIFDDYRRIKMFWLNRLDIDITDLLVFDHFTRKQSEELNEILPYDVHWLWGKNTAFTVLLKKRVTETYLTKD